MRIGIYPGSFDPITLGHLDIIERAAKLVDNLIIGVLNNSVKTPLFSAQERVEMIKIVTAHIPNVTVEAFDGLLVDFAKEKQAGIIVRGLRAVTDFEYELQMAQTNSKISDSVDTIFLATNVKYAYLSSSIVREIGKYGGDISHFIPEDIISLVYDKYK